MCCCVRSKAQVSMEFILLMGFMFVIFFGLVVMLQQRQSELTKDNRQYALESAADAIQREIRYGLVAGAGYNRTFEMPWTVVGSNYSVIFIQGQAATPATTLLITLENIDQAVVRPLPARVMNSTWDKNQIGITVDAFGLVKVIIPQWMI